MSTVRYYDYGVARMESERRMMEAQRRAALDSAKSFKRVCPECGTQMRPAAEPETVCTQSAEEHGNTQSSPIECGGEDACPQVRAQPAGHCKPAGTAGDELLIAGLLLLTLGDGGNLPLALALIYLLL